MSDKCETFVARWDHAMCSTCGAAHAPTPTPAPGLDLDAVERAERAMTPGPWAAKDGFTSYPESSDGEPWSMAIAGPDRIAFFEENGRMLGDQQSRNAAGIVALRNAAPALIAEVRALRAEVERLRADKAEAKRLGSYLATLRADKAEAKRLGSYLATYITAMNDAEHPSGGFGLDELAEQTAAALEAL